MPRHFAPDLLCQYVATVLRDPGGLPADDASLVAASLVDAELRGVGSHGVARVPIYVARLRHGVVETKPQVGVVGDSGGALVVDGGNGMGAVVLSRALDLALERLPHARTVSVAVRNSNHYGCGAYYAKRATAHGAAFFLYGNAPSTMAAFGGTRPFLGTNPYTFAVPTADEDPFVLDMATSVVARGKIILAAQRGEQIPPDWALGPDGQPTTDPHEALAGSLLPFGGPKGYGIALMAEVMAGVLSGAHVGPEVGDLYGQLDRAQGLGAFLTLVDVEAFLPLDEFTARMDALVTGLRATAPASADGEVLMPGELEARTARRRTRDGIPLTDDVVEALDELCPSGCEPLSAQLRA